MGASVRARLLSRARLDLHDFNLVLTRYALERLLYRLSVSAWSGQFLLKGALLFDIWFDQPQRPTRDIDLLGFGSAELTHLASVFGEVCDLPCDDGIVFDPTSLHASEIRKDASYVGVRVTVIGELDGARCTVQVDIGFGDAVTPGPDLVELPVLLDGMPSPVLRAYPVYTVVAEKYQAMVSLGMANTRMKDYFDLWILARHAQIDRRILHAAITETFLRRATLLPSQLPLGLSLAFASDSAKRRQWNAFLSKNRLTAPDLVDVVTTLQALLGPFSPC